MGLNLDLCQMLGVPDEVECPRCHRTVSTYFDDYDIECGSPNDECGVWVLSVNCSECEHSWEIEYQIELKEK